MAPYLTRPPRAAVLKSFVEAEVANLSSQVIAVLAGLFLALGMGVLLLIWQNGDTGTGIVGLLFMFGVLAGIIVVVAAALSRSDAE